MFHNSSYKANVKRALLGEAIYSFDELMQRCSGDRALPLHKSVSSFRMIITWENVNEKTHLLQPLEFPQCHASGQITVTLVLHSADIINSMLMQGEKTAGNKSTTNPHKISSRRTNSCCHLCIHIERISGLLLPGGIKKLNIYAKTLVLMNLIKKKDKVLG